MGRVRRWVGVLAAAAALTLVGAACAPAPPGVPSGSCGMDALSQEVLVDLNGARTSNGLPPLAANGQLTCLAQGWSSYLASTNSFFHRDLAGVLRTPAYAGYHTLGENLLLGPWTMSAADINTAWWNSPPAPGEHAVARVHVGRDRHRLRQRAGLGDRGLRRLTAAATTGG